MIVHPLENDSMFRYFPLSNDGYRQEKCSLVWPLHLLDTTP
jgi:hypothetical protein